MKSKPEAFLNTANIFFTPVVQLGCCSNHWDCFGPLRFSSGSLQYRLAPSKLPSCRKKCWCSSKKLSQVLENQPANRGYAHDVCHRESPWIRPERHRVAVVYSLCAAKHTNTHLKTESAVVQFTNRFNKKPEIFFTDCGKLQTKNANGSLQFTETTGETWICGNQFDFGCKIISQLVF